MLTLVESLSLAGDRTKQNDDACGQVPGVAWVIDGATDLHDAPLTGAASDASWFALALNSALHAHAYAGGGERALRIQTKRIIERKLAPPFADLTHGKTIERWQSPIASMLMLTETRSGVDGIDLGDCRLATLDAEGRAALFGGPEQAADAETALAAEQTDADKPLLQRAATIARLREMRAALNQPGAHWTACLDPACADQARGWAIKLARPAHLLLMTDGFSALVDRYRAYDSAGLMRAARDKGLQELGRELRAIEAADATGAKHPRFKQSDDATALLLRLT
ncbi:MAG TPA: protein phosphatase 2C domain-containing protein [Terricaulis sp.]|nr:protein phosphatase 2C domain-containing protein [Terricaulis sp.]